MGEQGTQCTTDNSYSYSSWHGKAVQPTREPEDHGITFERVMVLVYLLVLSD